MFAIAFALGVLGYRFCQTVFPSNHVLRFLRTRRGMKWALPACLILAPAYFAAMTWLSEQAQARNTEWLIVPAGLCGLSCIKLTVAGPLLALKLGLTKAREAIEVRRAMRQRYTQPSPVQPA